MPTLRGTGIQASSASSYTVSWPAGTVYKDLAIIMVGHGYSVTLPTNWISVDNQTGSNWNGGVFYKILDAPDINNGSVAVSFAGTFDGVLAIATYDVGTYGLPVLSVSSRNSSGSSTVTITGTGLTSGQTLLVFGSNRAASTDTSNLGTLQQTANDGSAASGAIYTATSGGTSQAATLSYSVAGSGNYQAIVALSTATYPSPSTTGPNIEILAQTAYGSKHQVSKIAAGGNTTPSSLSPAPVGAVLQTGAVSAYYSETITTAGGSNPYTYALTSGSLPTGLSLSTGGVITGTPTAIGTYTFTVTVTDSNGNTGAQAFSIIILTATTGFGFIS